MNRVFDYERPKEKDTFLISPVRGITDEEKDFLDDYVKHIETTTGKGVHYPLYDTDQEDSIGLYICRQNRDGIRNSNDVSVYCNPTSNGSMFDLGMTFMAEKELKVINPVILDGSNSPVARFLRWYALSKFLNGDKEDMTAKVNRAWEIKDAAFVPLEFNGINPDFLFEFGMLFMAEKPLKLINRDEVKPTPYKSFENVLLHLDDLYRNS